MRPFLSVIVVLGCLAPLPAEANPYAAYVAKYLGEYMLGKALDEAWDAAIRGRAVPGRCEAQRTHRRVASPNRPTADS